MFKMSCPKREESGVVSPVTCHPCSIPVWTPQSTWASPCAPHLGWLLGPSEEEGHQEGPGRGWSQRPGGLGPLIPPRGGVSNFPVR